MGIEQCQSRNQSRRICSIMGPSGCGKSTLLNILGLLDNPTEGTYELNGTDVSKFTEAQRTNLRKGSSDSCSRALT